MAKLIHTQFDDSRCVRCGHRFAKGDLMYHSKPIGVWCVIRCVPDFPAPTGETAEVLAKLVKLEDEGRLKGFTRGILERYRVFGEISDAHIACMMPSKYSRREQTT